MIPLVPFSQPNVFIEYNGYKFTDRCKSSITAYPEEDSSRRLDTGIVITIRVRDYITPRVPTPGTNIIGMDLLKPRSGTVLNPFDLAATTDQEVFSAIQKLTSQGKTLRYIGFGAGDLYVNTIDPNTGKYVGDINFGPVVKIHSLVPIGFNKAWKIDWELKCVLPPCFSFIDLNNPGKRIQEYNFSVNYSYDRSSMCKRVVQGHLKIISPMYRANAPLPVHGAGKDIKSLQVEEDVININYKTLKDSLISLQQDQLILNQSIDADLMTANRLLQKNHVSGVAFPPELSRHEHDLRKVLIDKGIKKEDVEALVQIYKNIYQNQISFNDLGKQIEEARKNVIQASDEVLSLNPVNAGIAGLPENSLIYPNSREEIPNELVYGPYSFDNVGNVQNYETADQYREFIEDSIKIPKNFQRIGRVYTLSYDKRTLNFQIIDQEQASFSIVPGYDKVSISHNTTSSGAILAEQTSTIRASFTFPKYIYGTNKAGLAIQNKELLKTTAFGLSNQLVQFDSEFKDPEDNKPLLRKTRPDKRLAYGDFLKIVFQRFGVALVLGRSYEKPVKIKLGKNEVYYPKINILPKMLSCDEDVTGNTIAFSIAYGIISKTPDFFPYTGHGLPAIIATDLVDDNNNATSKLQSVMNLAAKFGAQNPDLKKTMEAAFSLQFGKYTDEFVYGRWMESQKYALTNARGTSNLIFNRAYDTPISMCTNPDDASLVIPIHGENNFVSKIGKKGGIEFKGAEIVNYAPDKDLKADRPVVGKSWYAPIIGGAVGGAAGRAFGGPLAIAAGAVGGAIIGWLGWGYETKTEAGTWTPPTPPPGSSVDIDLFIERDELIKTQPDPENESALYGPAFHSEIKLDPDPGDIVVFNSLEGFVSDKFIESFSYTSPEKSWLEYICYVETDTQNQVVRHKPLANVNYAPRTDPKGISSLLQNYQDAVYTTGPDLLMGESIDSNYYLENPPQEDIIQIVAAPSNTLRIFGKAKRIGYNIVAPTVITYGYLRAFQLRRKFRSSVIGTTSTNIFYAEWDITYLLPNTPAGVLGVPINNKLSLEDNTPSVDNEELYDQFTISDQYIYSGVLGDLLDIILDLFLPEEEV